MAETAKLVDSEYGNVTVVDEETAESDCSETPSAPLIVEHRKFSPRGEVTHLLWLYVFMACMVVLFMCHSVVADTCGTYIAQKMRSIWSRETFDPIDTLRLVLVMPYAFIFASHSSMLMKRWTFFRFIDDRVRPDDDWNAKSPPVIKRSFGTILMSYVAINVYLLLVQLGFLLLQLQLDHTNSPLAPILEHRIFSSTIRHAALFLYTYQIFDIRTNFAILGCVANISILSLSNSLLYATFLAWTTMQYRSLCPFPVEHVTTVIEASPESTLATDALISPLHTPLLDLPVLGGNGSAIPGRPTVCDGKVIAIAECALLGGLCILLSITLSICSAILLLRYTGEETQEVFRRVDGLHAILGFFIALAHILMICSCKSVITQENTVIRFINDNTGESEETRAVDTNADTSRSTIPVWLSLIAMWLYTYTLGLVLSALFAYAKFTGRVPDVINIPTVCLSFIAGTFCYTYRVFDVRTNLMFATVIAILVAIIALSVRSRFDGMDVMGFLAVNCLIESYSYHCCTALEPGNAIYGSYSPPVLTSQTGTASDVKVGGVQEAPIYTWPAVILNPTHGARGAYTMVKDGGCDLIKF